ncbi:phage head completion protein [Sphingomonas sp. Leaf4]|uniref:phage head completion protein n=1 Tax=Sphingomonas sp. Leaf4 TaxID=2876553 RepID=UPI001E2B2939|nr:head-tail adaptor protein [Sphingomonas sp. Leaf4]
MIGLDPADLDTRITILRAAMVDDGLTRRPGTFAAIGGRWAKKTDVSDGERQAAAQQGQSITTRFLMYPDSLTLTITGKDRVGCGQREYSIAGVKERRDLAGAIEITASDQPDIAP